MTTQVRKQTSKTQSSSKMVELLKSSVLLFTPAAVLELVRAVTRSGHLVGDTIVQGSATSHMVPVEKSDGE